jgi:hypothetical protein
MSTILKPGVAALVLSVLFACFVTELKAQEATFANSTYPHFNTKLDGSRDVAPIANISGRWRSRSGASYSCLQTGRGFACVWEVVNETQQHAGQKVGDVAFTGSVYEYVAIGHLFSRIPPIAGAPPFCPPGYTQMPALNFRISDDQRTMQGEILIWHVDDTCTPDGATIQEALLTRAD